MISIEDPRREYVFIAQCIPAIKNDHVIPEGGIGIHQIQGRYGRGAGNGRLVTRRMNLCNKSCLALPKYRIS